MVAYVLTPPSEEPVSTAEARDAARLDGSHWDAIIERDIVAARRVAEHQTGRRLMSQVVRHEFESWPAADDLVPEIAPTAVAISYWDGAAWQTLAPASYAWHPAGPGRASIALAPVIGGAWPDLGDVAIGPRVRIDVTSGADNVDDVPAEVRQFICALVALMVADPTLTATAALDGNAYLLHLLDPVNLYR